MYIYYSASTEYTPFSILYPQAPVWEEWRRWGYFQVTGVVDIIRYYTYTYYRYYNNFQQDFFEEKQISESREHVMRSKT